MIKLKEGVNTKLIIEVTNEGTPYDGEVSFGIYNKKGEIIWQTEQEAVGGKVDINLPKIKENDYRFTLETDEGYSDIQDLIVSKSVRETKGELLRKYQIDINNERDEKYEKNIGKNKILMNEFYMNNGKRLKKLESEIEEHKGRMDMDKGEVMEHIGKGKEELKKELEDFSKVVSNKIEGVSKELVNFEKVSEEKNDAIIEKIENVKEELNDKIDSNTKEINTINKTIGDISKKNDENGLSISEKITRIENKIPSGGVLDYEVNDEGLSTNILWTSDKIDKRIRGEVGRQKKYVSYQNMFDTIAVAGQDNLQPTSPLDELTIVAGSNMNIITDAENNTITFNSSGGGGGGAVDSVNGQTGVVVLTQDDVGDGTTYKQYSATEKTKLTGIEAGADVTDVANVASAGAFMKAVDDTDDITVGTTNKFATQAEKDKLGHITVTQAIDLDQMEEDIAALANGMVYKGNWDASVGTFPGAGIAQTGWFYTVSMGGTVNSVVFNVDDRLVATVDNASTTTYAGNWTKLDATDAVTSVFGRLGNVVATSGDYTASQVTNTPAGSIAAVTVQTAIDELDTEKAPKTSPTFATSINGSYLTASEILITDPSKNIVSAPVATYPSLTELTYVKGVTSAIQTQLNAKQASDAQLTSLAGLSYGGNALKVVRVNAGETDFELVTPTGGTGSYNPVLVQVFM